MVRSQREFASAAERQPTDCGRDRLAAGLQGADGLAQREEMIEGELGSLRLRCRDDHVIGDAKFAQIGAGTECGRLTRSHDHTAHIRLLEPGGKATQFLNRGVRKHVHGTIGHVEYKVN
jgi:hypothetical protein